MALTRHMLRDLGIADEAIDKIMSEHGKVIEGMTTKAQAEEEQKKALEDFRTNWEKEHPNVKATETTEYKELNEKYQTLVFDSQMKQAKVQDKYREFVKSKLPADKSFEDGIKAIQEEYPEFFEHEEPKTKPETNPAETAKKPIVKGNEKNGEHEAEKSDADKAKEQFLSAFGSPFGRK